VGRLREAQGAGTLESKLMSPTRPELLIANSSLWDFAWTTFQIVVYLAIGMVFGLSLARANIGAALLVLVFAVVPFVALGILAASIIMVTKRGDPLTWMVGSLFTLFGGVLFPVSMLPTWLQPIANLFPTTIALDAMRLALLQGASLDVLLTDIIALLLFAVILAPVSLVAFRIAVDIARRDGSLAQF
jgi:ABC-2 type transport system permease protein